MNDGSMSGEEYLRRARVLQDKYQEVENESRLLAAHQRRAEATNTIDKAVLVSHFQHAMRHTRTPNAIEVSYLPQGDGDLLDWDIETVPFRGDADLVIHSPHNLPTLVVSAHPCTIGHHSMTEPMRQQLLTGEYPTVAGHQARTTPAYEPKVGEFGNFEARLLTQEEEDAIFKGPN